MKNVIQHINTAKTPALAKAVQAFVLLESDDFSRKGA